ncbi:transcriptional regulator [Lichenifustis flavocetrariae]|uniref:Transcriptional regulator n=1 Tax=Lichenifustis flavocetrariae TaxID=2949735 RepID=A0AA42CS95_9HYPH|nr:transcriptional regulator [Lichenifustis flavocetrariae]MCW6513265.1 transcriptional regulator [Lichenifustis flavocetrariae]
MITGCQIREARRRLNWTVRQLATGANVPEEIIVQAEGVDSTPSITLQQGGVIRQTFERAGVRFGNGAGVLMLATKDQP